MRLDGLQDELFHDEDQLAQTFRVVASGYDPSEGTKASIASIVRLRYLEDLRRQALQDAMAGVSPRVVRPVVQFWDTADVPSDVKMSIDLNRNRFGMLMHRLFSRITAREFIGDVYPARVLAAFEACGHPAMQSDFFRLAYLYAVGGVYLDADDEMLANADFQVRTSEEQAALWLSPGICDAAPGPDRRWYGLSEVRRGEITGPLLFYFFNDAMAGPARHEVIRLALVRAVREVERAERDKVRIIAHGSTGPMNITIAVATDSLLSSIAGRTPAELIVFDRDHYILPRSDYEYKNDSRNWIIAGA
jgi:hypothetical protein